MTWAPVRRSRCSCLAPTRSNATIAFDTTSGLDRTRTPSPEQARILTALEIDPARWRVVLLG